MCFNVELANGGTLLFPNGFWQWSTTFESNYHLLIIYLIITSLVIVLRFAVVIVYLVATKNYQVCSGNYMSIHLFLHIVYIHLLNWILFLATFWGNKILSVKGCSMLFSCFQNIPISIKCFFSCIKVYCAVFEK